MDKSKKVSAEGLEPDQCLRDIPSVMMRAATMDPRLGGVAAIGLNEIMGGLGGIGGAVGSAGQDCAKEACPAPGAVGGAQQAYDPTVGDMIRDQIREMQGQIKHLEGRYIEAQRMGLLSIKARVIRELVGW